MKKTRNILRLEACAAVAVALMIVVIYETDLLPAGTLVPDKNLEFVVVSLMELLTICLIPLALRLFKFKAVSRALKAEPNRGLRLWGSVRMAMICLPMIANALTYYLFMNVALGYMGIIGLICLVMINPTMSRCVAETGGEA